LHPIDKLFYEPVQNKHLPCWIPDKAAIFQKWHDSVYKGKDIQHQELPNYIELSDSRCTLQDYKILLFPKLLKLSVHLHHIENNSDGVRNVYLIQLSDNLDASHHNPNDYLFLCVEYNIKVNKLYTIVADHYKISVTHVVLMLSANSQLPADDVPLHSVFYHPVILYKDKGIVHEWESYYHVISSTRGSTRRLFMGEHNHCFIAHCELASKAMDDPIIKHVVAKRPDAWEVIFKVFNFNNPTRISIEENSEDDRIRCMDVMHRIYHHGDDVTWEFVEIQVGREDPQLADVIRTHL